MKTAEKEKVHVMPFAPPKKRLQPLGDHVLVTPIPEDKEMVGPDGVLRLQIPDNAQDKPQRGIVVSVGEGRIDVKGILRPIDLAEGERVLFGKYAGNEFSLEGQSYIILSYDDILIRL